MYDQNKITEKETDPLVEAISKGVEGIPSSDICVIEVGRLEEWYGYNSWTGIKERYRSDFGSVFFEFVEAQDVCVVFVEHEDLDSFRFINRITKEQYEAYKKCKGVDVFVWRGTWQKVRGCSETAYDNKVFYRLETQIAVGSR